ncbi:MAG: vanadium-dependent haloperoxidase, partial [Candidatus Rokuibacteriota bacterium]
HAALVALHAPAAQTLHAAYAASLAAIPDSPPKAEGIRVGKAAAAAVLEMRAADGWNASASYTPANRPGRWVSTPPAFAAPLGVQWGRVKPFALQSADQFRAAPPPPFDSAVYVRDLREVFEIGGTGATRRTPEVTNAARFWIVSAMQTWNPAARQVSAARRLTLSQNARLLALLNIAMADALIACWDSKFAYDTWRPVTAIKAGGHGAAADAGWTPLITTPPFPAYPSGHACAAGAARAVLDRFLGPNGHSITLTSPTAPGVTFPYDTFKAIADQVDEARVGGGIHVRHDQTAGAELGRRVGEYVCQTVLRPLNGKAPACGP